jgi:hypothetical protein
MTKLPWFCCGGVGSRIAPRCDVISRKASDVAGCVTGAPRALKASQRMRLGRTCALRAESAPPVWDELVQRARLEDVA